MRIVPTHCKNKIFINTLDLTDLKSSLQDHSPWVLLVGKEQIWNLTINIFVLGKTAVACVSCFCVNTHTGLAEDA